MAHFENHQSHQSKYQLGNQPPVTLGNKTIQLNNLNADGKVRNPLTGIYIYADGRLATRLRKEGILEPSPPTEHKIRRTSTGRVTSKNATFVINKITRDQPFGLRRANSEAVATTLLSGHGPDQPFGLRRANSEAVDQILDQPLDPEINQRLNQSHHNHYKINFQSNH